MEEKDFRVRYLVGRDWRTLGENGVDVLTYRHRARRLALKLMEERPEVSDAVVKQGDTEDRWYYRKASGAVDIKAEECG